MPFILGVLALALTFVVLQAYTRTSPALLARLIKKGGGALCIAIAGLLLARGRLDMGLALGAFGVWLMGYTGGFGIGGFRNVGAGSSGQGRSRVRSAIIEMELDHATGALSGGVLAGVHEGKALASLSRTQLLELYAFCQHDDPDGARLLEAYLDRRFPGWRAAGDANANAGSFRSGSHRAGTITEDEAYEILGLKKGAPAADIARAHRDLMKKLHPDLGGTTDLAARVNEAKEILMRRRQ